MLIAKAAVRCREVAFSVELMDLDCWGSWEGSLPESSSLGGDCTPLRGAFIDSGFPLGIQELTAGKNYINFAGLPTLSPPSSRGGLALSGPPKWPILSPPPTDQHVQRLGMGGGPSCCLHVCRSAVSAYSGIRASRDHWKNSFRSHGSRRSPPSRFNIQSHSCRA